LQISLKVKQFPTQAICCNNPYFYSIRIRKKMATSLQYCSDLHLEFENNSRQMNKHPLIPSADVLLLGGDIVPFANMERFNYFFDWVADNYKSAYWIPGNHEYYHSDINERTGPLHEQIRKNVFLVNNNTIAIGDTELICSTMWSKIDPMNEWAITRAMSDFHIISDGSGRLSINRYNSLHHDSLTYLLAALANSQAQHKIVLTHHVPTFMNYPPKYKGDVLNEAFATELNDLILSAQPDCWIYGHTHYNTADFSMGRTRLLTNQLGYVKYGEHSKFSRDKVLVL
jgi:predicted phosphohydrolase